MDITLKTLLGKVANCTFIQLCVQESENVFHWYDFCLEKGKEMKFIPTAFDPKKKDDYAKITREINEEIKGFLDCEVVEFQPITEENSCEIQTIDELEIQSWLHIEIKGKK